MGKIIASESYLVSTDIGTISSTVSQIEDYDIEDMMKHKALSQARLVKWVVVGKTIDINSPTGPSTLKSVYFKNDEELLT